MQSTARNQNLGPSFAARRGHNPQLSISDDAHHVTEAIGYMYGDEDEHDNRRDPRTLKKGMSSTANGAPGPMPPMSKKPLAHPSASRGQESSASVSNGTSFASTSGQVQPVISRENSWEEQNGDTSPTKLGVRMRAPSETATAHFPLTDIDYESSPAAVAQELSNLHALRRMSMDVAAAGDPDLPSLNPAGMPGAPSHSDSEDNSARLFWVPARLHPELAPQEFKSFLNSKAEQIRRRSGELSAFSSHSSSSRSSSLSISDNGGLRRKKSMLSRQINTSVGYQDGADRLERKRSLRAGQGDPNLQELESLVSEGAEIQRLSLEGAESGENGDIILPSVPGSSLRRSTRTAYRRGGSQKGRADRTTYAQRVARKAAAGGRDNLSQSPPINIPPLPGFSSSDIANLAKTLQDPSSPSNRSPTNFSRPGRSPSPPLPSLPDASISTTFDSMFTREDQASRSSTQTLPASWDRTPQPSSQRRPSLNLQHEIPQIVEVPPPEEPVLLARTSSLPSAQPQPYIHNSTPPPERTSSREDIRTSPPSRPPMQGRGHPHRPTSRGQQGGGPSQQRPSQSLEQMSSHPSPLPGNDTNTGNLSFIPTLTEDRRADNRKIKDKKDESKKSGWGWLIGKDDAEKDKKSDNISNKSKVKGGKSSNDNTRLDVLQASIDGVGKGRESLVLERDGVRLDEERRKESQRKSAGSDMKKEKEGLFSSLFGGGKKGKTEKEHTHRKHLTRGLSPEPPYRELKPDIDYNWTRFSILEERAIYRMAHIKLANPRRALYSQVLLSNFMYSYLAKVQQMHPQMNLPTSAKQQKKQQQQPKDQPDEFTQYQRYQQQQQQQDSAKQSQPQQQPQAQNYAPQQVYEEDSSMYDYDNSDQRPSSRGVKQNMENGNAYAGGSGGQHGYTIQHSSAGPRQQNDDDNEDMW